MVAHRFSIPCWPFVHAITSCQLGRSTAVCRIISPPQFGQTVLALLLGWFSMSSKTPEIRRVSDRNASMASSQRADASKDSARARVAPTAVATCLGVTLGQHVQTPATGSSANLVARGRRSAKVFPRHDRDVRSSDSVICQYRRAKRREALQRCNFSRNRPVCDAPNVRQAPCRVRLGRGFSVCRQSRFAKNSDIAAMPKNLGPGLTATKFREDPQISDRVCVFHCFPTDFSLWCHNILALSN